MTPAHHLLHHARAGLQAAARTERPEDRFAAAHVAALRAAAALIAARARPRSGGGPRNVWLLLARTWPSMSEWATYFAAGADTRMAVEAGLPRVVSARDADDLVRAAETFVGLASSLLGQPVPRHATHPHATSSSGRPRRAVTRL